MTRPIRRSQVQRRKPVLTAWTQPQPPSGTTAMKTTGHMGSNNAHLCSSHCNRTLPLHTTGHHTPRQETIPRPIHGQPTTHAQRCRRTRVNSCTIHVGTNTHTPRVRTMDRTLTDTPSFSRRNTASTSPANAVLHSCVAFASSDGNTSWALHSRGNSSRFSLQNLHEQMKREDLCVSA